MLEVIGQIAEKGTLGLLAALMALWALYKDWQITQLHKENRELQKQLIEGYRGLALDITRLVDLNHEEVYQDEQNKKRLERGNDRDTRGPRQLETDNRPTTQDTNKEEG